MKKLSLVAVLVAFAGVVMAQGVEKKNEIGLGLGSNTFFNYPALSLFQDNQPEYTSTAERITYGHRTNNHMWGAVLDVNGAYTSQVAYNESVLGIGLSVMYRHYGQLGQHLEPYAGVKLGGSMLMNTYDIAEHGDVTRWGLIGGFELGLNYVFDNGNFLGISTSCEFMGSLSNDYELPLGTLKNERTGIFGYGLMITYGIRF